MAAGPPVVPDTGARPPVSIVVCSRDRASLLASSLAAVAAVRGPGDELVVVDSASTGGETGSVARAAGADQVVRCARPGLSRARNAGLRAARHDVVLFTDDDCAPEPGWVEGLLAALGQPGAAVATGAVAPVGGGFLSGLTSDEPARQTYPVRGNPRGHGASMAIRRADLLAIGGFDEELGAGAPLRAADDWDVFFRLLRQGRALVYTPDAVVRHEQWRPTRQALRVRFGYSLGAGALAVKCWRLGGRDDRRQAALVLGGRLHEGGLAVAVGVLTLRWFRAVSGALTLAGALRGAVGALRRPVRQGRFAPPGRPR